MTIETFQVFYMKLKNLTNKFIMEMLAKKKTHENLWTKLIRVHADSMI